MGWRKFPIRICPLLVLVAAGCYDTPVVGTIGLTNGQSMSLTIEIKEGGGYEFTRATKNGPVGGKGVLPPEVYTAFQAAVHIPGAHHIAAYRPYFGPDSRQQVKAIQDVIDQVALK